MTSPSHHSAARRPPAGRQPGNVLVGRGLAGLLSVSLGVAAGLLIARARRLARSSLVVAAHGFSWVRLGQVEMVAWSELKEFRETALPEPGPALALLARLFRDREAIQCEAFTADGRRFSFGPSVIQQAEPLRAIFRRVAAELDIPWSTQETDAR